MWGLGKTGELGGVEKLDFILGQSRGGWELDSGMGYSSRTDQPELKLLLTACCSPAP